MARGNAGGFIEEWTPVKGGNTYSRTGIPCTGNAPWFSMHESVKMVGGQDGAPSSSYGAWANRGLVIRSYKARINGVQNDTPYAAVYGTTSWGLPSANVELSIPDTLTQLIAGDFIEAELVFIVMPQYASDYYGPNLNLSTSLSQWANTWRMIHREPVGNSLNIVVSKGVLQDTYPVRIQASNGAEFTITGGLGYVPVTVSGLCNYRGYTMQTKVGSNWVTIDQSVHGNDFWQTYFDKDVGKWEINYNIPLDSLGDVAVAREFRLAGPGFMIGDLICDGKVDLKDVARLANYWLSSDPNADIAPEPNRDGVINFLDFAAIANHWLESSPQ